MGIFIPAILGILFPVLTAAAPKKIFKRPRQQFIGIGSSIVHNNPCAISNVYLHYQADSRKLVRH
jgi:hypothetical protein